MSKKPPRVLHPFCFAILPVVFLFSHNIGELSLFDRQNVMRIGLPLAINLAAVLVGLLVFNLLFKNSFKTGIVMSLGFFMFFSFGHAQGVYIQLVNRWGGDVRHVIRGVPFGHYRFFFSIWGIFWFLVIGGSAYWLFKTRQPLYGLTSFLNVVAGTLVIISAANIGTQEVKRFAGPKELENDLPATGVVAQASSTTRPDIYYIILDAYAAAETLQTTYGYDNREFLD